MPLYDYRCDCGREKEIFKPLKDYDSPVLCDCGREMKRLITCVAVHVDEAPWVRDMNLSLTGPHDRPITTRTEYKKRMEEKGVVPCD